MKKNKLTKKILIAIFILISIIFISLFAGKTILRLYIETGIGTCRTIPILCIKPTEKINNPVIDQDFLATTTRFSFSEPETEINMPKEFKVVCGEEKKVYFKRLKNNWSSKQPIAYLLYRRPRFFVTSFPEVTKNSDITDDSIFIERTMTATLPEVNNLTDAFFVIMKSIFTPDIGDQKNVKIIYFTMEDKRGFISYDITPKANYFDCNIVSNKGEFSKIYIKDTNKSLDLNKVMSIIYTFKHDTTKSP
jgi:hypothetical protein